MLIIEKKLCKQDKPGRRSKKTFHFHISMYDRIAIHALLLSIPVIFFSFV